MKILSIGNSFSQDAHNKLHKLAKLHLLDIETVNLYIGGCSLETHWKNADENNAYYDLEINGNEGTRTVGIDEALNMQEWDVITIQQVSALSGIYETYEPYLSSLVSVIKTAQPRAKIYLHQTWAYESDSDHPDFYRYDNNQAKMYECVKSGNRDDMREMMRCSTVRRGFFDKKK